MSTMLADVNVGTIDGVPLWVAPRYQGALTEPERLRLIAGAAQTARDVIDYAARGASRCTGEDCSPESHDVLTSFRREVSDLLYLTLNLGFVPVDMPETVRSVGAALGIGSAEIESLIAELAECVRRYRLTSRLVPGDAWLFDGDEGTAPRGVSWLGGLLAD